MGRVRNVSAALVIAAGMGSPAMAADAEWGCQILLCAASENPSWHGVPYCVPPMKELIRAMAKPHFSWPVCSAAGTGKPGHEPYGDCPAGYKPSSSTYDEHGSSSKFDQCTRSVRCGGRSSRDRASCQGDTIARPVRSRPYYFDIPQKNGQTKQFWFDLQE